MKPRKEKANKEGTWAYDTLTRRILEEICPRIQNDNLNYLTEHSEAQIEFNNLLTSLRSGKLGFLEDININDEDSQEWNEILNTIPNNERNWLESPWIIAEFYFYRRLMNIFPYNPTFYDVFKVQKLNGLLSSYKHIEQVATAWIQNNGTNTSIQNCLEFAILTSLWGNKKDLSLWPENHPQSNLSDNNNNNNINNNLQVPLLSDIVENLKLNTYNNILDNDINELIQYLIESSTSNSLTSSLTTSLTSSIGIIVDNAGYELISDFFLGYCLIELKIVDQITFYTKKHPTFVSDATTIDCIETIDKLSELSTNIFPNCQQIGSKLKEFSNTKQFIFSDDYYWCQPKGFDNMPQHIQDQLQSHIVTFIKGDANYRRILDDRLWPTDTPVEIVYNYWKTSVCALRTMKAEVGCGISESNKNKAIEYQTNWMVSGEWAVIQFYKSN